MVFIDQTLAKETKMGGDGKRRPTALVFMNFDPSPFDGNFSREFTPREVASVLCKRREFAWLDSSVEGKGGLSILASEPSLTLEGEASETHLLEAELKARAHQSGFENLSKGAAIGYFRFDGSFRFAFYDSLLIHSEDGWNQSAHIPSLKAQSLEDQTARSGGQRVEFHSEMNPEEYQHLVRRAQEYIAAGDIYQVCLAHRFSAEFDGNPWPLYLALRESSPAPHSAYLQLGDETILSSSPECFLKMNGRRISTRPIKGTRPRQQENSADEREALELQSSPKEKAELIMITDLERNDLGSVCEFGSVQTRGLLELERYAQVFHLVSTIEGTLRKEVSHVAAVTACFPGGSISGAPKKRALEIIRELEISPRNLFTGAIGYFGYNGESQFNIAIRTVLIRNGRAEFHVGAGITADSDPPLEWEETLHKAAGILMAAQIVK
jgi:anthranilate/para-aminobenzoate synthase component I